MSTKLSRKIAKGLKHARKTASMDEIAARCGVTRAYLLRVSQGTQDPSVTIASRIARGLDLRLEILEK